MDAFSYKKYLADVFKIIPSGQINFYEALKKEQEKERRLQKSILDIKKKYGKNAVLRGLSYEEGATTRTRNGQIGGHKA